MKASVPHQRLVGINFRGPWHQKSNPFFANKLKSETRMHAKEFADGLSLSHDIVKARGGEIKIETKEGAGAEFIIQLPNA